MPSLLREHQHELCDVDGTNGIVFGTDETGYLTLTRPVITSGDYRVGDVERPQEDGVAFGRDYIGPKTYTFEMGVLTDRANGLAYPAAQGGAHRANLDALNELEGRWRARKWRNSASFIAMLRSCEGGRTVRCYGRPRRWDEAAGALTQQGFTPVVAEFALVDHHWYDDIEQIAQIRGVIAKSGGVIAPIVAPITTTLASSPGSTVLNVEGPIPTWAVIEFNGPVSDPSITIDDDLTIGITGSIATGQKITIDPRPWSRSVLRDPGAVGVAGMVSAASPIMRNMRLQAGRHTATYNGRDQTGTSYARIRWRPARSRP
jgi:hypothetical protein